jgi:hypothetical protein
VWFQQVLTHAELIAKGAESKRLTYRRPDETKSLPYILFKAKAFLRWRKRRANHLK